MLVRLFGGLIFSAALLEAAVTAHEVLRTSTGATAVTLADRLMPLDEENDLRVSGDIESLTDEKLRSALAKNPWDTRSWIELSVHAEVHGETQLAEHALREAAAHDVGREPAWALANFYYRQGDKAKTLEWVNRYRAVTHEHEERLFQLLAQVQPDPDAWPDLMPQLGCDELGTAISVARGPGRLPNALVERMTGTCHDEASVKFLSHLVTMLLAEDSPVQAAAVWTRMGQTSTLDNAEFKRPVTGEGFDWRINATPNIEPLQRAGSGLTFALYDGVASGTVLLFQPELLGPGECYRLATKAQSDPESAEAFHWELVELSSGRHINSELDGEQRESSSWDFCAPPSLGKTIALALYYKRPTGAVSFSGKYLLAATKLSKIAPRITQSSLDIR